MLSKKGDGFIFVDFYPRNINEKWVKNNIFYRVTCTDSNKALLYIKPQNPD